MRLSYALAAVLLLACANLGQPPGGPVRTTPPILQATSPDSGDTNVTARSVVFDFDAIVSDREIESFFLISPREGEPRVRWRRSRVEVRPSRPFRPNTAYSVTMLPGITDLSNNRMDAGKTVVFSTGPTIPRTAIQGRVFEWLTERPAIGARVEAIRLPDSLLYVGVADSTGQFTLGPLDNATYFVRANIDANKNRAADPGEPSDSAQVSVEGVSPVLELLAVARDTLAPRLLLVTVSDSVTLVAGFDRPLDPTQRFDSLFRVQRQDSTPLRITGVMTRQQRDSVARARVDSLAAARDTTRRADPRVEALNRQLPPARGAPAAPARPSRRPPPQELTISLDPSTPLQPRANYRVSATEARGLSGRAQSSSRVIQGPAPRDSTRTPTRPPND